ncbi:serine protease [Streptomyces sp. APSN-46.1]|uniref:trypsin-like peptidase domain-containing protein n=1 Tax=Streptomyces sp. APSN-46.1 TaxID=2929049 RepID=UPI001FB5345A|nr:serine protease [Streptomyces sp. APSN-46.1]MCJ1679968.1 serine protease [Streptomyces sp. APSN-46.1]
MAELVRICDLAGRPRGSGFVADDRGTVVTSHEAVDGLTRVVLHGPGERTWLAEAEDVTPLPGLALALVRSDGLGVPPLPVALREVITPGTYVRLPARGWRQARVLSARAEATYTATERSHALPAVVELAIGTDGRDALRLGGEACGGPVLDAATGAVLAVLGGTALHAERRSGGLAVPLRAAAAADPAGALAALLERNAASVPGYGEELNLAGALELTGTTLGAALTPELPEPVERPAIAAELAAFTAGDRLVLGLVGEPGTGRTTALAALAAGRARGASPAPTLWLRGADLRAGDASLADAAARALESAARIVATPTAALAGPPHPESPAGPDTEPGTQRHAATPGPSGDRTARPGGEPGPSGARAGWPAGPESGAGAGWAAGPSREAAAGWAEGSEPGAGVPGVGGGGGGVLGEGDGGGGEGLVGRVAGLAAGAGRALLVVLDAPEEMPPELAHRLAPWTGATAAWLRGTGARLVVGARPEHWERAGALYPPEALHTPDRPARRMPPALHIGDMTPAEAELARARLGIPADAVREADARHPLTLRLLAGIRAAEVTAGRPGRDEVFGAHLDLLALRVAVRIAASATAPAHGPGVRRLAARVAGRVHEAARRCLGPGQGELDRASFEELFPWRTGWASAVLTEGLLVPAGPGYRFAHEELSDWLQAGHLDVHAALGHLVHRPAAPGLPVPRHRIGPVLEALRRMPPAEVRTQLMRLVGALTAFAEASAEAPAGASAEAEAGNVHPDRVWWASRLLRETLLRAADAVPHLPVLHALAEHVARSAHADDTFGGWFWNRLRLPEPDRLDLLRRLLPSDHRYLDAAARRLARDPRFVQRLLCAWFTDERRLSGRPGATVATAAQALLHTHRHLAVDDLTEALVSAAHPRADELLAVLAEEEPSALCRAVDRWAHDERPGRRVAAAAYGLATAPHVRTPADRELLRHAARALLARPADTTLHGSALGMLLRDPQVRARYLPDALACFRDPERGARLPATALVAALPVLPDPDAVFGALRARADGEVLRALAALSTPGLARRAGDLVRDHLARCPEDAPHAAVFVDRRLEHGLAAGPVLRPLVLDLLRSGPAPVRAALAAVLALPGGESSRALRGELAEVLLREENDPEVLGAFLEAVASGAAGRPEDRTRELLRRTGRQLLRVPGGPAVFERRTVELARADPAFGALAARWLAEAGAEAAALLGPSARRTVETLSRAAWDVT